MESIYEYLKSDFPSSQENWETNLKKELKTDDIGGLLTKLTSHGKVPILSLQSKDHYLRTKESWKKASQSYYGFFSERVSQIQEDLESGVRLFFFGGPLAQNEWSEIEKVFLSFDRKDEIHVVFLGETQLKVQAGIKTEFESDIVNGRLAYEAGGNHIHELALIALRFIEREEPNASAALFLDSEIFSNISKIRALKLMLSKITDSWGSEPSYKIIGLNSFQDWTLYERYSNILKNVAAVSAGYMGGVDLMQSSGFLDLFNKLGIQSTEEESSRSRLMARNTCHVLALESMLGVVEDAAFGSFHLESLTQRFATEAWSLMQELLPLSEKDREKKILEVSSVARTEKIKRMNTRKHVITGINDFADPNEVIPLKKMPEERTFRLSKNYEELRLRMSQVKNKPSVFLGILGDYSNLSARINFAKNYFELLGLKVREGDVASLEKSKEEILIICAPDTDYEKLKNLKTQHELKFLAGKTQIDGFTNIFSGQDVPKVLETILVHWEAK